MDDLLREFLTETGENLDVVDLELVRFEREPNNTAILEDIFRLVHTIKGTCGFLGLPRLEALTHAAESLMAQFRAGRPVDADAVTLVLTTIDRIKSLLEALEREQVEPAGDDGDLISRLQDVAAPKASALSRSDSRNGHSQRLEQEPPSDGSAVRV
jgi:two-component system, chemotaxis family, sensor kinase CheA